MKVLVVDDTVTMLMTTSAMVKANGHEVLTARNGREAIETFAREIPDLVLLDVMMPEMDGYEVARRIRALCGETWVPIIFLSGLIHDEDVARGIAAGGDDYLSRPVSRTVLAAKLHAMQCLADMRARLVTVSSELERANERLQQMIYQDGLTGIASRRHFDMVLERGWQRAVRTSTPLSLALVDVDHFKLFNDHNGHLGGDGCLARVAHALRDNVQRGTDIVARYGGEEFGVLLPDTTIGGCVNVAGRLRLAVQGLGIPHARSPTAAHVTVSIGCASMLPTAEMSPGEIVAAADKALYDAKKRGRNCVVRGHAGQLAAA